MKGAMTAAEAFDKGTPVKDQMRILATCKDMKENLKAWFRLEAIRLKVGDVALPSCRSRSRCSLEGVEARRL